MTDWQAVRWLVPEVLGALVRRYGHFDACEEAVQEALVAGPLRAAATDDKGDVRAVELDGHPFFVAMLCQPERAALRGLTPALVAAFVAACATAAGLVPTAPSAVSR